MIPVWCSILCWLIAYTYIYIKYIHIYIYTIYIYIHHIYIYIHIHIHIYRYRFQRWDQWHPHSAFVFQHIPMYDRLVICYIYIYLLHVSPFLGDIVIQNIQIRFYPSHVLLHRPARCQVPRWAVAVAVYRFLSGQVFIQKCFFFLPRKHTKTMGLGVPQFKKTTILWSLATASEITASWWKTMVWSKNRCSMNQQGSGFLHKMTFSMKWLRGGRARTSRGTGTNQFGILYKFALKRQRSRSTGVELSGMWSIKPMTPCAFVNDCSHHAQWISWLWVARPLFFRISLDKANHFQAILFEMLSKGWFGYGSKLLTPKMHGLRS